MTSHVLVANCSGGGACAVPYQLLTSSSDHVIDDVTAASPGRGGLWDVLRTALLGALAMSTDGVVAQRQGVRFAIKRSRVRSPARARLRTTTLGQVVHTHVPGRRQSSLLQGLVKPGTRYLGALAMSTSAVTVAGSWQNL